MIPSRLARPTVGRTPTSWLYDDGTRIDPPVSVPRPSPARFAATAAPVPPLDPPAVRLVTYGLATSVLVPASWKDENSDANPNANSSRLAFARITAPSARRPSTIVASVVVRLPSQQPQPPVVGMSFVS